MSHELPTETMPVRQFAAPTGQHISLGAPLRGIIFFVIVGILAIVYYTTLAQSAAIGATVATAIVMWIIISGLRIAAQWERGILLRLGAFNAVKGPGVIYVIPFIDYIRFVDTRVLVLNIPRQRVITRDNVPAQIDGALFFYISDPANAVIHVQDYQYAIAQYAQGALRDVVGRLTLDDLLAEREQIQHDIGTLVEKHIQEWGMHVESIRLLDIELPEDLKRMMSRQASAEREKRATITKAEGDKLAAVNLAEAARIMRQMPGAMQLRSLQTIDGLGPSPSNTVVLFPVEWVEFVKGLIGKESSPPLDTPPEEE
jgi:regulator of protease activity HflC (stomatin/prohibitin superfamily)